MFVQTPSFKKASLRVCSDSSNVNATHEMASFLHPDDPLCGRYCIQRTSRVCFKLMVYAKEGMREEGPLERKRVLLGIWYQEL